MAINTISNQQKKTNLKQHFMIKTRKIKIMTLIALMFFCGTIYAQNKTKDVAYLKSNIDSFFKIYEEESPDKAIDYLYSDEIFKNDIALKGALNNMKSQLNNATEVIGEYFGYELLETEVKGKTIISFSYLVKYHRQPILFIFIFYKPNDKWNLYNFTYSDGVEDSIIEGFKN